MLLSRPGPSKNLNDHRTYCEFLINCAVQDILSRISTFGPIRKDMLVLFRSVLTTFENSSKECENSELEFGETMLYMYVCTLLRSQLSAFKVQTLCQNLNASSMQAQYLYLDLINLKHLIN